MKNGIGHKGVLDYFKISACLSYFQDFKNKPLHTKVFVVLVVGSLFYSITIPLSFGISLLILTFVPFTSILLLVSFLLFCFLFFAGFAGGKGGNILWKSAIAVAILPVIMLFSLFCSGFACYFFSINMHVRFPSETIRFPLSDVETAVADDKGQVYVLSRFYNRLQMFDAKGNFIRGWFVGLSGGAYKMFTDEHNNICFKLERNGSLICYNDLGEAVPNPVPERSVNFHSSRDGIAPQKKYKIAHGFLYPSIVEVSDNGQTLFIKDTFWRWLLTMGFPAFGLLMIIVLMSVSILLRNKRETF